MSICHTMRKSLVSPIRETNYALAGSRLGLGQAGVVEIISEAEGCPIEGALLQDGQRGWRANGPGMQTIRLLFDHPHTIRLIRLVFREEEFPGLRSSQAPGTMSSGSSRISVRRT